MIFFLCGIMAFGCSPTKQAAKQDDALNILKAKFDADKKAAAAEAVAEWIIKNPCIPEEINMDSLCTLYCQAAVTSYPEPDTVRIGDTIRIKGKPYPVEKRILVPTVDRRTEKLWQDTISVLRSQIAAAKAEFKGRVEAPVPKCGIDWWTIKNWFFFISLGLFLAWLIFIILKIAK